MFWQGANRSISVLVCCRTTMVFSFSWQGGVFVFEVKTFTESSDDLMFCAYGRVFHNDIIPSYISEDHKEYLQCFNVLSIDKLQIFKIFLLVGVQSFPKYCLLVFIITSVSEHSTKKV